TRRSSDLAIGDHSLAISQVSRSAVVACRAVEAAVPEPADRGDRAGDSQATLVAISAAPIPRRTTARRAAEERRQANGSDQRAVVSGRIGTCPFRKTDYQTSAEPLGCGN